MALLRRLRANEVARSKTVGNLGGTAITNRPGCLLGDIRDFFVSASQRGFPPQLRSGTR